MSTQVTGASIQGATIRVTRLDSVGNLLNGPGDSFTTSGFMRFSFTPEYEAGDEITEKGANGKVCVTFQSPDTLKRITLELAICEPDPELTALISGGVLLRKNLGTFASPNKKSVGWASPSVGDDPSGYGTAVEVWSYAVVNGKQDATLPYFYWIFPYTKLRLSGDRVIENGLLANTFEGFGLGNDLFANGIDDRWEWPSVTDSPYSYARTDWAPTGLSGFYTWHGDLVAAVSNKARAANVATATTSTAHGFQVGDTVTVTGTTSIDGTFVITGVPTTVTFTYASTGADVTSAAVSPAGSATVAAGPRAVTDLEPVDDVDNDFNVPGSVTFNADLASDNIVNSAEDPTV